MKYWLLLIISLPTRRATVRMRVWRGLKDIGVAVLRDGVYMLPEDDKARQRFDELTREVVGAGGTARVLRLTDLEPGMAAEFRALFDRTAAYGQLIEATRQLRSGLSKRRLPAARRALKQLQRQYQILRVTDYFSGPAAEQAAMQLSETESALTSLASPGEPQAMTGRMQRLDRKKYQARTWATRARPWVDRLASAWLIRRFIDPKGRIVWLKEPKRCPRNALGFDFDGATFTHVGARVTFETLLASFGLESDDALVRVGGVVHYLDVGGVPVAEAAGVESILRGMREHLADDNKLLAEASGIFDHLYFSYQKE